ncbi:MAG: hypothetical protein ACT4OS_03685 [Acidimicrobiales bacterium]
MNAVPVVEANVDQERPRRHLVAAAADPVHAYLLVGPADAPKRAGALALAAALVCRRGGCGTCTDCRRALEATHPDVNLFERVGAALTMDQGREVGRVAMRSPHEADRTVLILVDLHLAGAVAPALLKTIEEPPATTVFIILADHVPAYLVTVASRCSRIDFASPRLDRASHDSGWDPAVVNFWRQIPRKLDGTGRTVSQAVEEIVEFIGQASEEQPPAPAAGAESDLSGGSRAGPGEKELGRQAVDERRRQARRRRVEGLAAGLDILAREYRDALTEATVSKTPGGLTAMAAMARSVVLINQATAALGRNPIESLLLAALLLQLPPLGAWAEPEVTVPYSAAPPG